MKTGATARGRGINIWMCSQQVLMSIRWCASAPLIGRYSRRCRSCVESFVWAFSSRSRYSRESENRGLLGNRVAEGIVLHSSIFVMRNAKLASMFVTSMGPIVKISYTNLPFFLNLSSGFQNNHSHGCSQIQTLYFLRQFWIHFPPYAELNFHITLRLRFPRVEQCLSFIYKSKIFLQKLWNLVLQNTFFKHYRREKDCHQATMDYN